MTNKRLRWFALSLFGIAAFAMVFASGMFGTPADSTPPASPAAPAVSAAPAATGQFEGSFDKLEVISLGGWAWDALRPNEPIKVEIYDGATLLAAVTADGFRLDLKNAGKGDGKHAFNFALPQSLRDGQSHTISIKYAGSTMELPGSPKTLVFPK